MEHAGLEAADSTPAATHWDRWAFAGIFLVAAALRGAHLREIAANDPFFTLTDVDGQLYDAWARNILQGLPLDHGVLFLGPLYAYFIALVYALSEQTPAAVIWVQCGLGVVSVGLVGLLAQECFDRRVALAASFIAAAYEMLIFYGGTLLVVNVQVPLLLTLTFVSVRALQRPTAVRWLACGLLCGLSALAQQTALLFAPVLLGGLLVSQVGAVREPPLHGLAKLALLAGIFCVGVVVLLLPFTLHNYRVSGDFVIVNSTGGANLYMGNNAYTDGTWVPPPIGRRVDNPIAMREAFTRTAEERTGRELEPSEVSAFWTREALDFIATHPGPWVRLELRKLLLFFNAREVWNIRAIDVEREFSWVLRLPLLGYGVVAPLGLLGVVLGAQRWRTLFPLYGMLGTYLASALAFFVLARYRMPSVPLLMIFAGFALVWLYDAARARRPRRLVLPLLALLAFAGLVHLPLGEDSLHMAYYNLGNKYIALARWELAIQSFEKSIAIRPGFISSHNNLAISYEAAGRRPEATLAWERVLALSVDERDSVRAERARRHLSALGAAPELPNAPADP